LRAGRLMDLMDKGVAAQTAAAVHGRNGVRFKLVSPCRSVKRITHKHVRGHLRMIGQMMPEALDPSVSIRPFSSIIRTNHFQTELIGTNPRAYAARVFLLRMLTVKNSRKRKAARSPAPQSAPEARARKSTR
jgi:hypothetical protein